MYITISILIFVSRIYYFLNTQRGKKKKKGTAFCLQAKLENPCLSEDDAVQWHQKELEAGCECQV